MTREELTHKWNGYKGIIIYPTDDVEELINATIEELEQEPKTDILVEIEKQEKWLLQAGYSQYNVDIVLYTIKSLLTKQEPKTEQCKIFEADYYKNRIIGVDINHAKAREYINHDNNM